MQALLSIVWIVLLVILAVWILERLSDWMD
jgi:hypothetical protein